MRTFRSALFVLCIVLGGINLYSQGVGINTTGAAADTSAILDANSVLKGLLVPRMTQAQRNAIALPASGLIVYQTDGTSGFYYNMGTSGTPNWAILLNGTSPLPAISGANLTNLNGTAITSGTVSPSRLGSGTPGSTNYLRGDGTWATPSGGGTSNVKALFKAYQSSAQTMNCVITESYTKANFQTEVYDPDGVYDNSTSVFTAPAAGTYLINASVSYTAVTGARFMRIYSPSASAAIGYDFYSTHGVLGIGNSYTIVQKLTAGQTIQVEVFTYNSSAGSVATIATGVDRSFFQVTRLE